jgi:hypothetical protein
LKFIQELRIRFLLEDLPPSQPGGKETSERKDMERSIRGCVETLISLFFCGDQYPARCQDTPAGIGEQIELWNFVSRNAPGGPYDQVVEKIISVISIPASEPSCERSFSRQKRIMGHSRVNSNRDLFRAIFQLKGGPSESNHHLANCMNRVFWNTTNNPPSTQISNETISTDRKYPLSAKFWESREVASFHGLTSLNGFLPIRGHDSLLSISLVRSDKKTYYHAPALS